MLLVFTIIIKRSYIIINSRNQLIKLYLINNLILTIFFSTDSLLAFYCFFELSLIPIFVLILGWGYQPERLKARIWLFIYTLIGSLPIIFVFLLYFNLANLSSFSNFEISSSIINWTSRMLLLVPALLLGILVKFPIYWLHAWLPRAHLEAPLTGSILLAAILLKLGGYAIFKLIFLFNWPVVLIPLKLIALIGGRWVRIICILERDIKKLIAYTSIAHISFVIIGYLSKTNLRIIGSNMIIIAHGVCSSALFLGCNIIYKIRNRRSIILNNGFLRIIPLFTIFWFFSCIGNIGGPPTVNFFRELFCIIRGLQINWTTFIVFSFLTFFAAVYSLVLYYSTQYGRLVYKKYKIFNIVDLNNIILHFLFMFLINFILII